MKRKTSVFCSLFSCSALCFVSLTGIFFRIQQTTPTLAEYSAEPVVIIDAGHGGMDGGAIGIDGQIEKEINLSIALKLDTMLQAYGFQTILTRNSDVSIHSADAKTVRQQKTSDLKNRLKLLEDTESGILISIHQNQYSKSSAHGTQVFYGRNCAQSKELAEMLQKTITGYLQPDNTREIKQATKDIYILYQATKPAVMVECGFLSNREEAARLTDEEYQDQIAFSICMALMNCLADRS
ncbi:MAG TPA: hypothetical protein DEP43_05650 [Ruminococcaceae bacterium]|nr:hypothetical protein [Oscillospiraceae bacterium]